ncbi:hypothetical protein GEMRC1_003470 [Eukaryota sp. GEM-RC1]
MSLAMLSSFGAAVLVFQNGFIFEESDIHWMLVVISFSVLSGFSLDYDSYLVLSVRHCKKTTSSDVEAISKGFVESFVTITSAALILIFCFSSLLMSSVNIMVVFGFIVVTAIFIDTFLIRSLLIPGFLVLFGELIWYPNNKKKTSTLSMNSCNIGIN